MKVGFTGTRRGMTNKQYDAVERILTNITIFIEWPHQFLFGLCLGADEEAAIIASESGFITLAYPSNIARMTSQFIPDEYAQEPKDPLKRNKDIVRDCDLLIATPAEELQVLRSGTWATIREAERTRKNFWIIYPTGEAVSNKL